MAPHHTLPTAQYETVQLSPPPQLSPLSPPARAASMEVTASPASLHPPQLLVPEPPSSTEVTYLSAQTQVHKPSAPRPSSPALSLQSSPALSLLSNSPWTPPLRHRQRHNHVARHLFSESSPFNLPPELWLFLQNLDRRLEKLTNSVDEIKSAVGSDLHSHSVNAPVPHHTSTCLPVETQHSLAASTSNSDQMPELLTSPHEQDPVNQLPATPVLANGIAHDRLMIIRSEASSIMNFAVRILREICPAQELIGKNITGVRGKEAVDPNKVTQIRELIKKYYPSPPYEGERNWRECRKAMDSYLRKLPRQN